MKNYVFKKWYKHANHRKFTYPDDVDAELLPMLDVFNNLPGVRTCMSCCGHGKSNWYMTFLCTSDYMVNVILNYFSKNVPIDENDEWQKRVQTTLEFDLDYDENVSEYHAIPEKMIIVSSNELGKMSESGRCREYKKICEFFSHFMPYNEWTKIHEF